ncbi:MAG: T9SS type A sorting domain-containing protein [bacterium]|nr:T9SS type A sorting domain-containing protein [bacterium]
MKRPNRSLDSLFDAARHEASPLSQDDVRALIEQPPKKKRSPVMIPMLIAGVIITIAGMTSSVVLDRTNQPDANSTSTTQSARSTHDVASRAVAPALSTDTSVNPVVRSVSLTKKDASCSTSQFMQPIAFDWQRNADDNKPALCQIKCVYPAASSENTNNEVKVYFATVRANREVTDRLSQPSAPVPVLCTDSRGRACSPTNVAFFPSDYAAIAGRLNELVPVTYAGRPDILAWYEPSAELVQAFPDSMQDELETLLDIEISYDIEFDTMSNGQPFNVSRSYKANDLNVDSLVRSVRKYMDVAPRDLKFGDTNIKAVAVEVDDQTMIVHASGISDNPDSVTAFREQSSKWIENYMRMGGEYMQNQMRMNDRETKSAFLNIDSIISVVKSQLHCGDSIATQNYSSNDAKFKSFRSNDSTMRSFVIRMKGLDSSMASYDFNVDGNLDSMVMLMGQFSPDEYSEMKNRDPHNEMMKLSANTRAHIDSTMKLLNLKLAIDSMTVLPKEFLKLRDVQVDSLRSNKKVYNFKRKINLDSTTRYGDSKRKQRFQSRIVIKSTTKRSKNAQVLPSVARLSDLTPTSNGAITSTTVYPNPATEGGATMSFVLSEPRTLTLTLLDLNGNVVATLTQDARRTPGKGQFAFALSNVPAGMYLATLTTDKGERAMQRLIVQ